MHLLSQGPKNGLCWCWLPCESPPATDKWWTLLWCQQDILLWLPGWGELELAYQLTSIKNQLTLYINQYVFRIIRQEAPHLPQVTVSIPVKQQAAKNHGNQEGMKPWTCHGQPGAADQFHPWDRRWCYPWGRDTRESEKLQDVIVPEEEETKHPFPVNMETW